MNNLSSYCELVDAKIRASDKDLPVLYEFYFQDIVKILQIVGPLGHTISIKKWHTVFFLSKYLLSASLQSTSKYTSCLIFTHITFFS